MIMKLSTWIKQLSKSNSNIQKMHNFNSQLVQDELKVYWDEECITHPTNSHCKLYDD